MKVGQMLGYIDPTFADEFRGLLSILQTTSPAMPFKTVERTIREAFGGRAHVLVSGLQPEPIAVATDEYLREGRLALDLPSSVVCSSENQDLYSRILPMRFTDIREPPH